MPSEPLEPTKLAPEDLEQEATHKNMNNTGLRIGRHYSPGGKNILASLVQALDEPASAMQFFAGNPRRYWGNNVAEEDTKRFVEHSQHLYKTVHCCYITNIGEDPDTRSGKMTRHCLVNQLEWAEKHGCDSVVFHPGSSLDYDRDTSLDWASQALRETMIRYQGPVHLLLENSAGDNRNRKISGDISELPKLIDAAGGDNRLGICIDTTHAYAAGYDVDRQIETLSSSTVKERLELLHFNTPDGADVNGKGGVKLGSHVDRHSSCFTDGVFSMKDLQKLFLAFRGLPLILEGTPDLPADAVWLLSWQAELQNTGELKPPPASAGLGDIFKLADESELEADSLP